MAGICGFAGKKITGGAGAIPNRQSIGASWAISESPWAATSRCTEETQSLFFRMRHVQDVEMHFSRINVRGHGGGEVAPYVQRIVSSRFSEYSD